VSTRELQHTQPLGVLSLGGAKTLGADYLAFDERDRQVVKYCDNVKNADAIAILETPRITAELTNLRDELSFAL
jgi:hypothetical protein